MLSKLQSWLLDTVLAVHNYVTLHYIAVFIVAYSKKTARNHYGAVTMFGYECRNTIITEPITPYINIVDLHTSRPIQLERCPRDCD